MTFKPGNCANPYARGIRDRILTDALRMAVKEIDPKTGHKKLRVIANKLVELAMQAPIDWMANRCLKPISSTTTTKRSCMNIATKSCCR
jgi:hypothetical protein